MGADDRLVQEMAPGHVRLVRQLYRPILLIYWIALVVATHWPRLRIQVAQTDISALQLDKVLHFGAFGALTGFAILAMPGGLGRSLRRSIIVGSVAALLYSVIDEALQAVPGLGREFGWIDLLANIAGVAAVGSAAWVGEWSIRQKQPWAVVAARAALAFMLPLALLLLFIPGLWLGPILPVPRDPDRFALAWRFDWLGHLIAAPFALWIIAAARPLGRFLWLNRILALIVMVAAAPLIEHLQMRAERGYEIEDIIAHQLGVALGVVVWAGYALGMWQARRGSDRRAREVEPVKPVQQPPSQASPPAGTIRPKAASFVGGAAIVSSLTFVSRLTGLVRESVLAAGFGRGPVADAFVFGFQIPNLFRRLFGEGALSAALIPVYADHLHRDAASARRLVSLCLALLTIVTAVLTLAGEAVLAALLARGGWGEHNELAIRLTMVMLPYMPMVCLVAVIGSVLHVHGRFATTAAAPVLLNLVIIAATLWATWGADSDAELRRAVYVVAWSVLAAGVLQLVWQVIALLGVERLTMMFAGVGGGMNTLMRRFLPTAIGLGIFQINTFLDNVLAMALRADPEGVGPHRLHIGDWSLPLPLDTGDVAALAWAQRLYEFPLGIFGIAIATAIFPALASAAAHRAAEGARDFRDTLRQGLRLTMFIGLPASVGLILVSLPLVRVVFERRQFSLEDSQIVTFILAGYAPAIWAYSMNHVITRGFYALGDTRTPLWVSTAMVVLNLALNLTLVWFLGPAGFAWATATCAVLQAALLLLAIRHYVDHPVDRSVWLSWLRTAAVTLLMGAALYPVVRRYDVAAMSLTQACLLLAGLVALGVSVFGLAAWMLRAPELRWLVRRRV